MSATSEVAMILYLSYNALADLVSMAYADAMALLPRHVAASMCLKVAKCWPVIVRAAEISLELHRPSWPHF